MRRYLLPNGTRTYLTGLGKDSRESVLTEFKIINIYITWGSGCGRKGLSRKGREGIKRMTEKRERHTHCYRHIIQTIKLKVV